RDGGRRARRTGAVLQEPRPRARPRRPALPRRGPVAPGGARVRPQLPAARRARRGGHEPARASRRVRRAPRRGQGRLRRGVPRARRGRAPRPARGRRARVAPVPAARARRPPPGHLRVAPRPGRRRPGELHPGVLAPGVRGPRLPARAVPRRGGLLPARDLAPDVPGPDGRRRRARRRRDAARTRHRAVTAGHDGAGVEPAAGTTGDSPRRVASRAAIYTAGSAAPAVASLVVIPLITRLLSQREYDVVALGTVVVQVGVILVALGMGAAITREYILGEAGARGARGLVVQWSLISVLVAGLALALGPLWGPAVLGRPWDAALALAVVASLGGGVVIVVQADLRGAERPVPFVLLAAGGTLVGPAVGLVVVLLGQRTGTAYLAALAAGYVLSALAGVAVTLRSGPRDTSWVGLRRALRLGAPTVPHQIAIYVAIAGLVVVADRLLDAGGTANIVLTLGAGATVLTGALNNAW